MNQTLKNKPMLLLELKQRPLCPVCGEKDPQPPCTFPVLAIKYDDGMMHYERLPAIHDCPLCGVLPGQLHHTTCSSEVCPLCGELLGKCACNFDYLLHPFDPITCSVCIGTGKIHGPDFGWIEVCMICHGTGKIGGTL